MTGARAETHSGKRIAAMFGVDAPTLEFRSKKGVDRAPRTLGPADMERNNNWVSLFNHWLIVCITDIQCCILQAQSVLTLIGPPLIAPWIMEK